METNERSESQQQTAIENALRIEPGQRPVLKLDTELYQSYLDDMSIPEDRIPEMMEIIWNVMVTFVDLGFGIAPVQQAMEPGQISKATLTDMLETTMSENIKKETSQEGANT